MLSDGIKKSDSRSKGLATLVRTFIKPEKEKIPDLDNEEALKKSKVKNNLDEINSVRSGVLAAITVETAAEKEKTFNPALDEYLLSKIKKIQEPRMRLLMFNIYEEILRIEKYIKIAQRSGEIVQTEGAKQIIYPKELKSILFEALKESDKLREILIEGKKTAHEFGSGSLFPEELKPSEPLNISNEADFPIPASSNNPGDHDFWGDDPDSIETENDAEKLIAGMLSDLERSWGFVKITYPKIASHNLTIDQSVEPKQVASFEAYDLLATFKEFILFLKFQILSKARGGSNINQVDVGLKTQPEQRAQLQKYLTQISTTVEECQMVLDFIKIFELQEIADESIQQEFSTNAKENMSLSDDLTGILNAVINATSDAMKSEFNEKSKNVVEKTEEQLSGLIEVLENLKPVLDKFRTFQNEALEKGEWGKILDGSNFRAVHKFHITVDSLYQYLMQASEKKVGNLALLLRKFMDELNAVLVILPVINSQFKHNQKLY